MLPQVAARAQRCCDVTVAIVAQTGGSGASEVIAIFVSCGNGMTNTVSGCWCESTSQEVTALPLLWVALGLSSRDEAGVASGAVALSPAG